MLYNSFRFLVCPWIEPFSWTRRPSPDDAASRPEGVPLKIYVGNLNFATTEGALRDLFAQHGEVEEVRIITDRETDRSRGFGFVTMPERESAAAAIETLNRQEFDGRALVVNEARPKEVGGGHGNRGGGGRRY